MTTGLILQELLQGFRTEGPHDPRSVRRAATLVPDRRDQMWTRPGENKCRRGGVQIGTIDALLAQLCLSPPRPYDADGGRDFAQYRRALRPGETLDGAHLETSDENVDFAKARKFIDQCWDDEIVPTLVEYIKIPNKSPSFDLTGRRTAMEDAVALFEAGREPSSRPFRAPRSRSSGYPERTPVIIIDAGEAGTPCCSGHLRQAARDGRVGGGTRSLDPRLEGDKLYMAAAALTGTRCSER